MKLELSVDLLRDKIAEVQRTGDNDAVPSQVAFTGEFTVTYSTDITQVLNNVAITLRVLNNVAITLRVLNNVAITLRVLNNVAITLRIPL